MRILITGATSPIGRLLVARLSQANQVVGLSRRADAALDCPVAVGDLRDTASVLAAAAGCQAVLHCAVPAGPDAAAALAAAPTALSAAIDVENIHRLVVVSHGAGWAPIGGETGWSRAVRGSAEALLFAAAAAGRHAVGLAPGMMSGAQRVADTPADALPDEQVSVVSPRDVAGAAEGALFRGRPGAVYPLPGHVLGLGALRAALSPSGGPGLGDWLAAGRVPGAMDGASSGDLGWWTRSLERTLREVL